MTNPQAPFAIGTEAVPAGRRQHLELPVARLPTGTGVALPVTVLHGRSPGATIWLSAAIHGDELNGIEVIRRVVQSVDPRALSGTVIAVPIVNVFGFIALSRYLPDRRDLNRSFPGSSRGSLAGRLAHMFMREVVDRCEIGIDLHTGSHYRTNLPQLRADLGDGATRKLARTFGAPVMMHARLRDGSLRQAAVERGARVLLFEGGEALRFDRTAIDAGVVGILRVMAGLEMLTEAPPPPRHRPFVAVRSRWVRASRGGILDLASEPGTMVEAGEQIGVIRDTLGAKGVVVRSPVGGMVVGVNTLPLVHRGDPIVNVAIRAGGPARRGRSRGGARRG